MGQPSAIILPDLEPMLAIWARRDPDPLAVRRFQHLVAARRILLVGWVRQGLLSRAADERAAERLHQALAPFPDLPILAADHVRAAALSRRLNRLARPLQAAQALFWVMAERIGAQIWSNPARWSDLVPHGAPLWNSSAEGA